MATPGLAIFFELVPLGGSSQRGAHLSSERTGLWINRFRWITRHALLAVDYVPTYMFLQPRSLEGASGGIHGGAGCGARAPCLASTGPERLGDPPWGKTTPRDSVRYRCRPRPAPMLETRRQRESPPQAVQRRAERRRALRSLRQGDAHARQGVHTLLEAPLGAPPLDLRGQPPAVPRRGTRDGHPRGRPTPRRISHGCLTL